jgi:hypothetical protein
LPPAHHAAAHAIALAQKVLGESRKTRSEMNVHEYQAKAILREFGVPVPRGIAVLQLRKWHPT